MTMSLAFIDSANIQLKGTMNMGQFIHELIAYTSARGSVHDFIMYLLGQGVQVSLHPLIAADQAKQEQFNQQIRHFLKVNLFRDPEPDPETGLYSYTWPYASFDKKIRIESGWLRKNRDGTWTELTAIPILPQTDEFSEIQTLLDQKISDHRIKAQAEKAVKGLYGSGLKDTRLILLIFKRILEERSNQEFLFSILELIEMLSDTAKARELVRPGAMDGFSLQLLIKMTSGFDEDHPFISGKHLVASLSNMIQNPNRFNGRTIFGWMDYLHRLKDRIILDYEQSQIPGILVAA